MYIDRIALFDRGKSYPISNWVKFGFHSGTYMNEHALRYHKELNIVLSVPTSVYFPLFIAMGITEKRMSTNKQERSIIRRISELNQGDRVIIKNGPKPKKTSVVSVGKHPTFADQRILYVKDGKMDLGIAENKWIQQVTVLDEHEEVLKRSRKVEESSIVSLDSNAFLTTLFSKEQLKRASFIPGTYFYLIGDVNQVHQQMVHDIFMSNNTRGSIQDFLYLNEQNSYRNGQLISSKKRNLPENIDSKVPVIFSDSKSFLKMRSKFKGNPMVIIINRSDNQQNIDSAMEIIQKQLIDTDQEILTDDFRSYLQDTGIEVPVGMEYAVWRSK